MRTDDGPGLPSSSSKPPATSQPNGRAVTVENAPDEDDDERMEVDTSYGAQNGIAGDDSYADEGEDDEDEGGRFFGGGLTKEQKEIMNIFDRGGGEDANAEDVSVLTISRRQVIPG